MSSRRSLIMNRSLFVASAFCLALTIRSVLAHGQSYRDFSTTTPLEEGDVLVIGFMGGRESWDNDQRGVRKQALRLRAMNLSGVHVETVENKKRKLAIELIRNSFDCNQDGNL